MNQAAEHMCNAIVEEWKLIIIQAVYTKNGNISVRHRSRRANDGKAGHRHVHIFWYRTVIHLSVDGAVLRTGV